MRSHGARGNESEQQASGLGLEGVSPDTIRQLMAMLAAQPIVQNPAPKKSPKSVLPLDADERGFGDF